MPDPARPMYPEIETPALLVDLVAMEHNLRTMAQFFCARAAKLRPHFKNHRVLELAGRQIEHAAIGITCAWRWQAERLLQSGIRNILIANEVAGETSLQRFVELSREAPVLIAADNAGVVREMARLARNAKVSVHVLVDVDLGLKRCGVAPGEAAVSLAQTVVAEGLSLRGIMGYEGHLQPLISGPEKEAAVRQAMQSLISTKRQMEAAGFPVEIVSCGGTGDSEIAGSYPGVTEIQAGSCLLMDTWYAPYAPQFRLALSVLTTVISKSDGARVVLDAGVKAISGERGLPSVKAMPGLKLKALHAEHAPAEILGPVGDLEVGDKIEVAVQYHDGTIQLHDRMYGMRNGGVERIFSIEHGH